MRNTAAITAAPVAVGPVQAWSQRRSTSGLSGDPVLRCVR